MRSGSEWTASSNPFSLTSCRLSRGSIDSDDRNHFNLGGMLIETFLEMTALHSSRVLGDRATIQAEVNLCVDEDCSKERTHGPSHVPAFQRNNWYSFHKRPRMYVPRLTMITIPILTMHMPSKISIEFAYTCAFS